MRVLVAYATKLGGTTAIAEWVGDGLRDAGLDTDVTEAGRVRDVADYDAVVVGAPLYANRWLGDARRFVTRNRDALRQRPVWMFSSGPLDDSATSTEIPPVKQVTRLMRSVRARGHVTFGGRLEPDARGFLARAMAKTRSGDWRDPDHAHSWALTIAKELVDRPR